MRAPLWKDDYMPLIIWRFVTIMLTALAMSAALAH
jgi:hypothetical protein